MRSSLRAYGSGLKAGAGTGDITVGGGGSAAGHASRKMEWMRPSRDK